MHPWIRYFRKLLNLKDQSLALGKGRIPQPSWLISESGSNRERVTRCFREFLCHYSWIRACFLEDKVLYNFSGQSLSLAPVERKRDTLDEGLPSLRRKKPGLPKRLILNSAVCKVWSLAPEDQVEGCSWLRSFRLSWSKRSGF